MRILLIISILISSKAFGQGMYLIDAYVLTIANNSMLLFISFRNLW